MRNNKVKQLTAKQKSGQFFSECLEQQIRRQLSPLAKFLNYDSKSKNCSKQKSKKIFQKCMRYTSPSSCQNSELVSKKHSRQRSMKFKNNIKDNNGAIINIKKKKKKVSSIKKNKQNQINRSLQKQIRKNIQDHYKNLKWKKKLSRRFSVEILQNHQAKLNINSLKQSLKLNGQVSQKQQSCKSFFGYFLSDFNQNQGKKISLLGAARIIIIDWMYLISVSLLLNRQTVHLAVHYLDSYYTITQNRQQKMDDIHIFAAASLYLSVKQQERQIQSSLLETLCLSQKFELEKEQVLERQKVILTRLNFRLKSNTLAFWIDYFSAKWDLFIGSVQGQKAIKEAGCNIKLIFRSSDGQCYKLYRELIELCDVCLMFPEYIMFQKCKLSLAIIYLVIRIEFQKSQTKQTNDMFKQYYKLFQKKASPIFKDPYRINQIFNSFLTQTCQFQITQIIPCIKFIANFLQLDFCYNIDQKALEQTKSYEDFIRRMTYSYVMKDYSLAKIK